MSPITRRAAIKAGAGVVLGAALPVETSAAVPTPAPERRPGGVRIEGLLPAWASDDDGRRIGEYHFSFTATPGPDGWVLEVAHIMNPDQPVRLRLGEPVAALIREVVAELYGQPIPA